MAGKIWKLGITKKKKRLTKNPIIMEQFISYTPLH